MSRNMQRLWTVVFFLLLISSASITACGTPSAANATPTPIPAAASQATPTPEPTATTEPGERDYSPNAYVKGTPQPTLKPGTSCPITPVKEDDPTFDAVLGVAGEYPIWFSAYPSPMAWSKYGGSVLPPYQGRLAKQAIFVDKHVQGDLLVTGRQLDGEGIVLFPNGRTLQYANIPETSRAVEPPPTFFLIRSAQVSHEQTIPATPGYALHPSLLIYPSPGCYELTATIAQYTVHFVFEIVNE